MTPTAHDLAAVLPLLRTAAHVDAVRALADAIQARLTDPDAPALDAALGLSAPAAPEAPRQHPKRPSGPSKTRQRAAQARQRRDVALRLYWRTHLPDQSAGSAAATMIARVARYTENRLEKDIAEGNRPVGNLEQVAFDAKIAKIKIPAANSLKLILLGHR